MPMFYRTSVATGKGNLIAADLIAESIAKDPSGNAYIRGTPCLTPTDLLNTIHEYQPDVQIESVQDLPGLFRSLIARKARVEGFTAPVEMSRMVCSKPGSRQVGDHFNAHGFSRVFRSDEYAYFLPNHTEPFGAEDCTNIARAKKVPPPPPPPPAIVSDCVRVHVALRDIPDGTVESANYEIFGSEPLAPSVCHFKGHRCPDVCAFDDVEAHSGIPVCSNCRDLRTTEVPATAGTMTVEMSAEVMKGKHRFAVCLHVRMRDGTLRTTNSEVVPFDRLPGHAPDFVAKGFTLAANPVP